MTFAVLWKTEDAKILVAHPGTFSSTEEKAKEDGRDLYVELEGSNLTPVAVVDIQESDIEAIFDYDEVYFGKDEDYVFYDVTNQEKWSEKVASL